MKVLALASYPTEAACTRYRLVQYVAPLAARGITLTIRPFIDSRMFQGLYRRQSWWRTALGLIRRSLLRLRDVAAARNADVVLIQREAMIFGPPLVEWSIARVMKRPLVLDLDDATYVPYTSPTYGKVAKALKFFSKTDDLIRWSRVVICGNQGVADYVTSKGGRAEIIPTVVDTEQFKPKPEGETGPPIIGWVGTHSTYPFVESILAALEELAKRRDFRLKIVGAGKDRIELNGIKVENHEWQLEREIEHFQSLDIGLYPIKIGGSAPAEWAAGKSGFKAIQYMAVGIPFVATPIGAASQIGQEGVTHFFASAPAEWINKLETLIDDAQKRRAMGDAGRRHAIEHYHLEAQAEKLAQVLGNAAYRRSERTNQN